ncbi:MAG: signal peptide peptidase SppA [Alphaproteobacteria bacterium]|nr:signal peptide peptidase SppA [Alphaproteobacteria bacterium]
MSLEPDLLIDRRQLKRRVSAWRALAVVAIVAAIVAVALQSPALRHLTMRDHIARLTVQGLILDDPLRREALQAIIDDDRVQALLVVIDSPGGTTTGGESLYRDLRRVAETGKPVVAVIGTLGTSAGYMVALAADRIYALDTSITGSIGVILESAEISGLLQKLGVTAETFRSGPLKGQPSLFEPTTDPARQATQAVIDDVYQWFLDLFAQRRGLEREQAQRLADGRIFSGRQAVAAGLIDGIGSERDAIEWLESDMNIAGGLRVIDIDRRTPTVDMLDLVTGLAKKVLLSERLRLDGLMSVWHSR